MLLNLQTIKIVFNAEVKGVSQFFYPCLLRHFLTKPYLYGAIKMLLVQNEMQRLLFELCFCLENS